MLCAVADYGAISSVGIRGRSFWLDSEAGGNHVDVVAEGCDVDCRWGLAVEVAAVSKVSWRD